MTDKQKKLRITELRDQYTLLCTRLVDIDVEVKRHQHKIDELTIKKAKLKYTISHTDRYRNNLINEVTWVF